MPHSSLPKSTIEMHESGLIPLTASELETRVRGKCFAGLYRPPFQYVMRFGTDHTLWGQNNFGTQDAGHWSINHKTNALSVSWQSYWDENTTHGYSVGKSIHLFDVHTGEWRTTLTDEIDEREISAASF